MLDGLRRIDYAWLAKPDPLEETPATMRVVIAPDKFKESLSALQAAEAMARGVVAAAPDASIDLAPMADGGEGTVDALVAATGGSYAASPGERPIG